MGVEPRPIRLSSTGKCITIAIIIALAVIVLRQVSGILAPFVAAAITAYLFNPLIRWLHRRTSIGRAVWILVLYVLGGTLVYGLGRFLTPLFIVQYDGLLLQTQQIIGDIRAQLLLTQVVDIGGISIDLGSIEEPLVALLTDIGRGLPETVPHLFVTAIESVVLFVTFLMVTFYFLLQADLIVNWAFSLVPTPYRAEIRGLGHQIDRILAAYIRGTLLLIPIMAAFTYVMLTVLGVRYALVIAIATGFLEVIPLIGPWSAAGIAMSVALFQATTPFGWENWVLVAVVGVAYFVLRMFEDNFIIPQVVGHAVKMHPVVVLFAILAGGALAGPFGLLVSIPTVAIITLLLRYLYRKLVDDPTVPPADLQTPATRPIAVTTDTVPRVPQALPRPSKE